MQLYILNPIFQIIGVIDEAESILWNKKYNDVGSCEIYVPCDEAMLSLLSKGNYVYRYDDDMFCRIDEVEIETDVENGDYIIATASDICNILSGRIVRWQIVYSGTVAEFIRKVLTDNVINPAQLERRISNFEIDDSNFAELTDRMEITTATEDLLNLIIATCKSHNYGFRVSYNINTRKLIFRIYKGKNKATVTSEEYVEFSPTFGNIISSRYKESDSNYKNVAYVGYKTANDTTALLSVYNESIEPTEYTRREVYVDGTGVSRDITLEELEMLFGTLEKTSYGYYIVVDGEIISVATISTEGEEEKITASNYTYLLLIRRLGLEKLAEHSKTQAFEGSVDIVDTYQYKADYDIGDIVKIKNEYGIEAEAQIDEVLESEDNEDGYTVEPTFKYLN